MKKVIFIVSTSLLVIIVALLLMVYNTKPTLELKGEEVVTLEYNSDYKEDGAVAKIRNKDITDKIKIDSNLDTKKIGEYKIEYIAKNHKKTVTKTRTIKVVDTKAPTIKLNGNKEEITYLNEKYVEKNATALDEYDGDITSKIAITGKVDTTKEGTYTLIYKVADSSNNEASIERKVIVKKKTATVSSTTNNAVPVLMYHYFYDKTKGDTGKNNNYMEIHDFEAQMKYLKENDFYFPTYQELLDYVNKRITLPDKSVVVTVDDGQSSFFSLAVPIVNKYNVKVTSFIIGKNGNKFKSYLSDNINYESHTYNMHRGGCEGGHGGIFQCISYNEGLADLKKSIEQLGSSDALAYPYGDINANTKKITKAAGFKVAFTTKYGYVKPGMDPLELPRVRMSKGMSLSAFKKAVG